MIKKYSFWFGFAVIVFLYIGIKYFSQNYIEFIFQKNNLSLLNALAGINTNQSLDYYLGAIEDRLMGPIISILSGFFLILLGLKYFTKTPTLQLIFVFLIFQLLTKFEVLFFPAYGDPIGGPWIEGWWLYKNNFDYPGLLEQEGYARGGPKVYVFSLYPGYLALLMKIFPNPTISLFVNHLLNFLQASVITVLFYNMMLKITSHRVAFLSCALLISLPLFQSMTEILNMEMPSLLFAVLTIYFLSQHKFLKAAIMSILCLSIKVPGAIACATVFVATLLYCLINQKNKSTWLKLLFGILPLIFTGLFFYTRSHYVNTEQVGHNALGFLLGWQNIVQLTYILKVYILCVVILIIIIIKEQKSIKLNPFVWLDKNYLPLLMFLITGLWLALYVNFSVMGPRYKLLLAPFLLFCIIFSLISIIRREKIIEILLIIAILVSYSASYGLFYKPVEGQYYAYIHTERSLEYRNDLKLHMKLAKEFKENFPEWMIGAPFITAQTLAYPEFGYVRKPLSVVIYGNALTYEGITNFNGLQNLNLYKTMWIGFKDLRSLPIDYPIAKEDKIIKQITVGNKSATLFMGGFAIDRMYKAVMYNLQQRLKK